jgi:hypothetical protein
MARRKRSARKMTAKQLKYFGPKRARKGVKTMPRRRRYYAKARSYGRRAMGSSFGPAITGLIAGAARNVGARFIGGYGAPLAELGVGYFMKNQTAMYMAGRDLGSVLSAGFIGGSTGNVI